MKKLDHTEWLNKIIPKFYLKMKFTILFLTVILFQAQANSGYSQNKKISLNLKEVNYLRVFEEIESKTDFNFFYKTEDIDKNKKISIRVKNRKVETILEDMFQNTGISFVLLNKQIVLQKQHFNSETDKNDVKKTTKDVDIPAQIEKIIIKGKITDENGDPLPGASVAVKGKNIGVSTDIEGAFSLNVPDGSTTLVISFVGYKTLEVEIGGRQFLDIQLETDIASLSEVVVIGYGTVKKEDLTGSVGVVKVENITNQAPTVNLDYALQGQIAGVHVSSASGQPGAAARVRIRGTTSLFGSNQPLYVIDGIPVIPNSNIPIGGAQGQQLGNQLAQRGISTPLGNINSADIKSISVLKDASAAAIYGSRASNGVIIITTKQGVYEGAPKFDVDLSVSTQKPNTLEVLNAAQFREAWTTAVENGSSNDVFAQSVLDGSYFGDADTNWEDEITPENPITTNFTIGVFGGSKKTRYSVSLGANSQNGVYEGSGFERFSFNSSLDTEVNSVWKFGSKINLSFTNQDFLDGGITQSTYNFRPDLDVFDSLGNYSFSQYSSFQNPVALSKARNSNKTLLLLTSFFTELKLADGLHLKTLLAVNYNNGNQKSFYPKFTFRGGWGRFSGDGDGYAQESRSRSTNTLWQNTLTYNKSFDNSKIDAILGISFEESKNSNVLSWGEGFFNDVLTNISSATVFTNASANETSSGLASYFGRVNYNYNDTYILNLSARVDGSSKFAVDNKYAFFPAVGVAWKLSNESFLENSTFVNELKLRASAGVTGQQNFGPYTWRTLYGASFYGDNPSIILSQLGNNSLKWETTDQFDIGLDFAFLKGRMWGTVGYYIKDTKDALFTAITPGSTGFGTIIANVANTSNKGIEIELSGDVIRTDDFNWNLSVNLTKNNNKLTKIADDFKDEDGFLTGFGGGGRLKEGSPIGLIFGYVSEGIFQTQDEIDALNTGSETGVYQDDETAPGDLKFRDITGPDGIPDGRVTNLDQQIIGDTQPVFFGGINSVWSYKGFTLSSFFTFSIGNDLDAFGLARDTNFRTPFAGENKIDAVFDAWSPENPSSNIPRLVYRDPNNNNRTSSRYVYDASYIRLKTLNLNYSFSNELIQRIGFLSGASIYVSAQNLLTITKYPGADPEASNLFNNDISAGRDNNRFPIAKVYTVGVRIGF
ncbi:MAG: TonB-dependent receptor [Cyclobacteriaceae bacterium]|nr:TonB-dependent receptor [Cyclobacteriaceae bacterium]